MKLSLKLVNILSGKTVDKFCSYIVPLINKITEKERELKVLDLLVEVGISNICF